MRAETSFNSASDSCVEVQLVQACLRNQPLWIEQLLDWLASDNEWLKRRCLSLLGSRADAEDAVQEITLKVIRSIARFEGRSSLRTWVGRIVDNHCFSFMRKRTSHVLSDHLQHCIALVEADRFPEATAQTREQLVEQVRATLERLNDRNREILALRYLEELSIQQMAETLNLSQSATKMRLYRAMDVFKLKFENVYG